MACNTSDHFQVPAPIIYLKSSDGQVFQVEVKATKWSLHIKEMLDDLCVEENQVLPTPENAPEISGTVLGKIVQWANHHKDDPPVAEDNERDVKFTNEISRWDAEFLQVDQTTLFQIIRVVKNICKHISSPKLLKLSTINSTWSYEAGRQVKKRGNLMASLLFDGTRPCKQVFEAFRVDLGRMDVVPYSGIAIVVRPHQCHARRAANLDSIREAIPAQLPVKHFSVGLAGVWCRYKDCPAVLFVKRIFEEFSAVLEGLTLSIEDHRGYFIQDCIEHCNFPSLKVLKLEDENKTSDESYANYYIKELLSRAPNLEKLQVDGLIDLKSNVMHFIEFELNLMYLVLILLI